MKGMVVMGKQINFYMSENVQNQFIDFLISNNFLFLDNEGNKIDFQNLCSYNDYYLYKNEFGYLLTKNNSIDVLNSPIIEFCKTRVKENRILRGRLWISDQYYKSNNAQTQQSKNYIMEYNMLAKWIKKNVPYQNIKKGEFFVKEYTNDELIQMEKTGYIFTA
mgnify:FL=1